jgi:PKD repeat protein
VPGNHDIGNNTMLEVYKKHFGTPYYHFVYKNVLFLILSTEDPPLTKISDEQVNYFKNVLKKNSNVRWTFVFMHQPMYQDDYKKRCSNWPKIEEMLQSRNYTVFAGHYHGYSKITKFGKTYIRLATTGGASNLSGIKNGAFDHILWVTMTEGEPVFANVMLDGIYDENLKYHWNFGDGINSTQENPTHTYKNYSDYLVKLTIMDSLNASFSTSCIISIRKYEPLNYTFSRKNFTETEENKTTYLNLYIKNPLSWKVNAYINFVDYGDVNLTKTQYNFELNPNETKILTIPMNIKKTSTIKWNLAFYPEIKNRYENCEISYYLWEYSERIEVLPPTIVKINRITKHLNLNTTDVILKINKNKVSKNYVIHKTINLDAITKKDVIYYCITSLVGFIVGVILVRIIK